MISAWKSDLTEKLVSILVKTENLIVQNISYVFISVNGHKIQFFHRIWHLVLGKLQNCHNSGSIDPFLEL